MKTWLIAAGLIGLLLAGIALGTRASYSPARSTARDEPGAVARGERAAAPLSGRSETSLQASATSEGSRSVPSANGGTRAGQNLIVPRQAYHEAARTQLRALIANLPEADAIMQTLDDVCAEQQAIDVASAKIRGEVLLDVANQRPLDPRLIDADEAQLDALGQRIIDDAAATIFRLLPDEQKRTALWEQGFGELMKSQCPGLADQAPPTN